MSDIFYSVEWIPKTNPWNCWNQQLLTHSWVRARLAFAHTWLDRHKECRVRIREV